MVGLTHYRGWAELVAERCSIRVTKVKQNSHVVSSSLKTPHHLTTNLR